ILAFVQAATGPLVVDTHNAWLRANMPKPELHFLERMAVQLIVPLFVRDQQLIGLIVLGMKKSEEPFRAEDKNLLMAIAETVADTSALTEGPSASRSAAVDPGEDQADALWQAAEAVVRGDSVNWPAAAALLTEDERRRLRELQLLADLFTNEPESRPAE